jgi:exonuclease III
MGGGVETMKILTWNILRGGSKRRLPNITETIINHDPDVLILTEFWEGSKGTAIKQQLMASGWEHQCTSNPAPETNGILIASKRSMSVETLSFAPEDMQHRWIEATVDGVRILALHIPMELPKPLFWDKVVQRAATLVASPSLIIGDYNTGLPEDAQGTPFEGVASMKQLMEMGWHDAWRICNVGQQEYSWYSHVRNGFRIDHAFVSNPLKDKVRDCWYSHTEREERYSDHSALLVALTP